MLRFISISLISSFMFFSSSSVFADEMKIPDNVRKIFETVEQMEALPVNSLAAVKAKGTDEIFFVDQSGRFVIRGTLYDMWNGGKLIDTIELAKAAGQNSGVQNKKIPFNELEPLQYGTGNKRVVIFVDPYCPYCHVLINNIIERTHLAKIYTFNFIVIPVTGSKARIRTQELTCSSDKKASLRSLIVGDNTSALPQEKGCTGVAINKRMVTAKMINLKSVPLTIAPDGRVAAGNIENLELWLENLDG